MLFACNKIQRTTNEQQGATTAADWKIETLGEPSTWPRSPETGSFSFPSHLKHWVVISSTEPINIFLGTPPPSAPPQLHPVVPVLPSSRPLIGSPSLLNGSFRMPPPPVSPFSTHRIPNTVAIPRPPPLPSTTAIVAAPAVLQSPPLPSKALVNNLSEISDSPRDYFVKFLANLGCKKHATFVRYVSAFIELLAKSPDHPIRHEPFTREDAFKARWTYLLKTDFFDATMELLDNVRADLRGICTRRDIAKALHDFCQGKRSVQAWATRMSAFLPKIRVQCGWTANKNNKRKREPEVVVNMDDNYEDIIILSDDAMVISCTESFDISDDEEMPPLKVPRTEVEVSQ